MRFLGRQPTLKLRHHSRLQPPLAGLRLASATAGPDDVVACAWTTPEGLQALDLSDEDHDQPYAASTRSSQAVLTTQTPTLDTMTQVSEVLPPYPTLQPLPGGRFLWVGARAAWRPEGSERNALVFDANGAVAMADCVGDGVAHVQTSAMGAVWLGFSDEGVYGNIGWGGPGPTPLGHSGIACYSSELEQRWQFPGDDQEVVDDCYALNVIDEVAWAYYYSAFPIVRIADGCVTSWQTRTIGAEALITDGAHAALVGGYGKDADRVVLGRLEDDFTQLAKTKIVMPDNSSLPDEAVVQGRGDQLHVFVKEEWFRAELSELL